MDELPFGGLCAKLRDELDALSLRQRARARELVSRLAFRRLLPGDDPAHGLEDRAWQVQLGIEDIADDLLRVPRSPAIGEIAYRHRPDVEALGNEILHLRHALDRGTRWAERLRMKDKAIFLDMGDEIAADALFVDWVEPVVPRNLVSSSGRWSQDLVEKADQIGGLELLDWNVDRFQRRNGSVAHRHQIIGRQPGALTDADRHDDAVIADEEGAVARESRPRAVAELVETMSGKGLEDARGAEAR